MLEDDVVGYQVQVKGLQHRDNTREVVEFDVVDFNTEMMEAFINQLGTCTPQLDTPGYKDKFYMHIYRSLDSVFFAAGEVPYNITVKAINLAGCGEEKQIYCFTKEGGNHHDQMLAH